MDEEQDEKRVYVVNMGTHDYKPAEQYGELVFMTRGILNLNNVKGYGENMRKLISDSIAEDYLLFSGPTVISALAVKIWFEFHQKCKIIYSYGPKDRQRYKVVEL